MEPNCSCIRISLKTGGFIREARLASFAPGIDHMEFRYRDFFVQSETRIRPAFRGREHEASSAPSCLCVSVCVALQARQRATHTETQRHRATEPAERLSKSTTWGRLVDRSRRQHSFPDRIPRARDAGLIRHVRYPAHGPGLSSVPSLRPATNPQLIILKERQWSRMRSLPPRDIPN